MMAHKQQDTLIVQCEDKYEAQKLASLIMIKDENTGNVQTFIKTITATIKNEIIILLVDGSSHSILLKDESAVESFADFIQSVTEQNYRLNMVCVQGTDNNNNNNSVLISKSLVC